VQAPAVAGVPTGTKGVPDETSGDAACVAVGCTGAAVLPSGTPTDGLAELEPAVAPVVPPVVGPTEVES